MRKKGFTMVELVVAFALASVLFVSMMTVLAPAYRTYQRTRAQADALLIAGNVIDTIRTTTNIAQEINAENDTVKVGDRLVYSAENGVLLCKINDGKPEHAVAQPVFDEKYYSGLHIRLATVQEGANIVSVTVYVSGSNMPEASASAILSPLRRILLDSTNAAAEGALDEARRIIRDNPTAGPDVLFGEIYPTTPGALTEFPVFDVRDILRQSSLISLRNSAHAEGTAAQQSFFDALTDGRAFYLATYVTDHGATPQAVAYVTDMTLDAVRGAGQSSGSVYFVYFDNVWYIRNPDTVPAECLRQFDGKSEAQIRDYLRAGGDFIPANSYRIS